MRTIEAELVVEAKAVPGEGPMWHEDEGVLYWVDIMNGLVHRYDPASGTDRTIEVGEPVGAVVPRASGGLVAALKDAIAYVDFESAKVDKFITVEDDELTRFNDGKCDRAGRFWAGTMGLAAQPGLGSLYCLETDGSVSTKVSPVTISNGLAWTADDRTFYYTDSMAHGVDAYDYDPATGEISNQRRFVDIDASLGVPDGHAIDAEDHLWVAIHNSSQVRRFTPDGELDAAVNLPTPGVTSVCFAGPDLTDLYITTAALSGEPGPGGSLFLARPGVAGTPTNPYRG